MIPGFFNNFFGNVNYSFTANPCVQYFPFGMQTSAFCDNSIFFGNNVGLDTLYGMSQYDAMLNNNYLYNGLVDFNNGGTQGLPFTQDFSSFSFNPFVDPVLAYNTTVNRGSVYNQVPVPVTNSPLANGAAARAAQIAFGELGTNYADGSYKKYTNGRNEPWCADFVRWVYEQANGVAPWVDKKGFMPADLAKWGRDNNLYVEGNNRNGMNPGDIVIFGDPGKDKPAHTGIITAVEPDGTVHTIEGNVVIAGRKVAEQTYKPGAERIPIIGYIKMNNYILGQA